MGSSSLFPNSSRGAGRALHYTRLMEVPQDANQDASQHSATTSTVPLAARMRPRTLDEIVGQDQLLGSQAPFRVALDAGNLTSVLLWGPPGSGKTSLARLLAEVGDLHFLHLSAVMAGIKDLRAVLEEAKEMRAAYDRGTVLFVDEIHRWNKAQQDALLPHVEEGTLVLVGATTENPAFQIIPALRSRCWLLILEAVGESDLVALLERALGDAERGLGAREIVLTPEAPEALEAIATAASGDARRALSILERVASTLTDGQSLTIEAVAEAAGKKDLLHDAGGDAHYDVVSAFIKSLRGSDPDGALYWMARMIEGGEDPMFLARRMVIFASEDIGNADARALTVAVSGMQGIHLVGMPEARIILGQVCTYLAAAPKSNAAYKAIDAALATVRQSGAQPVPQHLRNAPTKLAKQLGHGAEYRYPHDFPHHIVRQSYLPPELKDARFYEPANVAEEKLIRDRLRWWQQRLDARDAHDNEG